MNIQSPDPTTESLYSLLSNLERKSKPARWASNIKEDALKIYDLATRKEEISIDRKAWTAACKVFEKIQAIDPAQSQRFHLSMAFTAVLSLTAKKDFEYFIHNMMEKPITEVTPSEITTLRTVLEDLYSDCRFMNARLLSDFLEYASVALTIRLGKVVDLMGDTRPPEDGSAKLKWKKIPPTDIEGTAVCAYLAKAQKGGYLFRAVIEMLHKRTFIGKDAQFIFSIWHDFVSLSHIQQAALPILKADEALSESDITHELKPLIVHDIRLNTASAYRRFINAHKTLSDKDLDEVLRELISEYERKSLFVQNYVRSHSQIIDRYEEWFGLYTKAIATKPRLSTKLPPSPLEFRRISLSFVEAKEMQQSLYWDHLFDRFVDISEEEMKVISPKEMEKTAYQVIAHAITKDPVFHNVLLELFGVQSPHQPAEKPAITAIQKEPSVKKKHAAKKGPKVKVKSATPRKKSPKQKSEGCPQDPTLLHLHDETISHEKRDEAVESLTTGLSSLSLEEAVSSVTMPLIPAKTAMVIKKSPPPPLTKAEKTLPERSIKAVLPPLKSIPFLYVHDRVSKWWNMSPQSLSSEMLESWECHGYPLAVTKEIIRNVQPEPYRSPTSGRVNRHYSCLGGVERFGEKRKLEHAIYTECVDGSLLYHHFIDKRPRKAILAEVDRLGTISSYKDLQEVESDPEQSKNFTTFTLEHDESMQITEGPLVTTVVDKVTQVAYFLFFSNRFVFWR